MKTDIVILAAGLSSRFGTDKLTADLNGKPLIRRVLDNIPVEIGRIILVTGYQADRLNSLADGYRRLIFAHNPHYRKGMFGSAKAGLTQSDADRVFIQPGDMPLIPAEIYLRMMEFNAPVIVPVFGGKKGHPVLIDRNVRDELIRQSIDTVLRDHLRRIGYTEWESPFAGVLSDVDFPQDLEKIKTV